MIALNIGVRMINSKPNESRVNTWIELFVFMTSYYPLFLILFIQNIGVREKGIEFGLPSWDLKISVFGLILLIISSLCTLFTKYIVKNILFKSQGCLEVKVNKSKQVRGDMINFTLPFLIGLFAFNYNSYQSIISLVVFLTFMFGFAKKENVIFLNPMFLLMNIRLYDVTYKPVGNNNDVEAYVLCFGQLEKSNQKLKLKKNGSICFISSK